MTWGIDLPVARLLQGFVPSDMVANLLSHLEPTLEQTVLAAQDDLTAQHGEEEWIARTL